MSYNLIDHDLPAQPICNIGDAACLVAAINHDLLCERGSNGLHRLLNEISVAADFVEGGWSQKALHRRIVTSATYRQASTARPQLLEKDPRNLKLLLPAASAATATKDFAYGESAIQVALQLAPQDPEIWIDRGQGRMAGDRGERSVEVK